MYTIRDYRGQVYGTYETLAQAEANLPNNRDFRIQRPAPPAVPFDPAECSGTFDGFNVISDADYGF